VRVRGAEGIARDVCEPRRRAVGGDERECAQGDRARHGVLQRVERQTLDCMACTIPHPHRALRQGIVHIWSGDCAPRGDVRACVRAVCGGWFKRDYAVAWQREARRIAVVSYRSRKDGAELGDKGFDGRDGGQMVPAQPHRVVDAEPAGGRDRLLLTAWRGPEQARAPPPIATACTVVRFGVVASGPTESGG
jgi:hypothetical protein